MTPARLRRLWRSSTFGFALLVFLLQLASAAAILMTVQRMTASDATRGSRTRALAVDGALYEDFRRGGATKVASAIDAGLTADPDGQVVMALADARGRVLAGNLDAVPGGLGGDRTLRSVDLVRRGGDRAERIVVTARSLPGGLRLLSGAVVNQDPALTRIVEDAMLGAALLALPLALFGALVAARVVDARVARIARTAHAVAAGDLSQRVPLAGAGDAFEELAAAINAMLERIEQLVAELRLVTDGLAHDLRLPLTRLRATLERAVASTQDPVALGALDTVAAEAATLLKMLTTALEISRAEAGIGRDARADTDVVVMIEDLVELFGPLAEEHGLTLTASVEPGLHHPLHRELASQALANLIDNAIKYGGTGHVVTMSARRVGIGSICLTVADAGSGIAAGDRAEALRRFGRLDPARQVGGAGLGLSLAAAVARLHEGTMRLEDNAPGLRVVLILG